MDIRLLEICPLAHILDFWLRFFVRRRVAERMISACVVPIVKHGGGGVMVCECFSGDLFRIQGSLNQHGYHSILQLYAIPSGLRLVELSFVFQQDNDKTHLQAV